jgi:hypothetical protein
LQEVLNKDDSFDAGRAFERILPLGAILPNLAKFENSTKVLKEYVINKLRTYTGRMQKNLNLATQKYIGDFDEPKLIHGVNDMIAKIICHPIADIFIGEVSIFIIHMDLTCYVLYIYINTSFFFRRNHNMKKL